jgi:hypothetical protein
MDAPENIVKMPDRLERRALKIEAAMNRRDRADKDRDRADKDWVEATLELAVELAGARAEYNSNQAFSDWLEQRFGARAPAATNRAILIKWGNSPDQARAILESTDSRSIQIIDSRFPIARNTENATKKGRPRTSKLDATAEALKAETGQWPTPTKLARAAGVHRRNADNALRVARAVEEAIEATKNEAQVDIADAVLAASATFTKAQQSHIDAVVRRRERALEKEHAERMKALESSFAKRVDERAEAQVQQRFPGLQERSNRAFRMEEYWNIMINNHKPIFTEEEFNVIRACLHPDNSASEGKRKTAFGAFNAVKLQLTGKK